MTRVVLFTGKGGVGKTTVAAATAARVAAAGGRTIVCSTDPAHSLGDAYGVPLGDEIQMVAPRLAAIQLDARRRLEDTWDAVRDYLVALFDWAGAAPIEAEELAVVPGLDEVFALGDIKRFADCGDYDLIVVDCAPTAETLRMLALPDVLGWYMERVFPTQRRVTKAMRPLLARVMSMPIASDRVFSAVHEFAQRLEGVRALLTDPEVTSARIVVNAEAMVVAEARRMFTYLHLFGYHVDAIIVNRLLPAAVSDPWFDDWRAIQATHLETINTAFAPVPIFTAELASSELIGTGALRGLAERIYGGADPASRLADVDPLRIESVGDTLVLSMPLPGATRGELELGRSNGDLLVTVGSHRRAVSLPDSLARREVGGARLEDDRLEVAFVNPSGGRS